MADKQMKCKDCKYAEKDRDFDGHQTWTEVLECRRSSPQVIVTYNKFDSFIKTRFPIVEEYDWCGEFKEREGE